MRKITVYIYVIFLVFLSLSSARSAGAQCDGDPTACYTPDSQCCSNGVNCCYCDQEPGKPGCSGPIGTYRCLSYNFCGGSGGSTDNNFPIGWLDVADCTAFQGWAGDGDNGNAQINVEFYADGVLIPSSKISANIPREEAVCNEVGGGNCYLCPSGTNAGCLHGYSFAVPAYLKDGAAHSITTWAYNIKSDNTETHSGTTGRNRQLSGTPKTITCAAPNTAPVANITGTDITSVPALNLIPNVLTNVYEGDILRFGASATDSNNNLANLRLINWGYNGLETRDLIVPSLSCSGTCGSLNGSYDFNTTTYGTRTLYFYTVATDQPGLTGSSGVVQVYVRPYLTLSGVLFDAPNVGSCSASSPAISNSGASVSAYNGAVLIGTSPVQSNGNYTISNIRYGSNITSMCVSIPAPPTGEYRLSCVNGENAYPQPTCYTLSSPINNMTVNRTLNVGLRRVIQEPWFTSLYSDVYGGNGISQTVPAPPVVPSTFLGFLGDWASSSMNSDRSYSFTASGGTLNVNGTGRSGRIYRLMSGTSSQTRGGFAMRMPYAADKMWPAAYINLTLPANVPVTLVNDKGILNTLDPSQVRVYRITNPALFDGGGTTYNLRNTGVAVLYYTDSAPLRIDGPITSSAGNERIFIVSTIAPIEIGSLVGTAVPTTGTLPQIQAGLITTATGANNVIRYLSNGGTDRSIVVEGPVISKTVDMQRNLGFVNNEAYPTNVYVYNYNYLYQLTRAERNSLDVPNYTGLSVVDVSWGVVQ